MDGGCGNTQYRRLSEGSYYVQSSDIEAALIPLPSDTYPRNPGQNREVNPQLAKRALLWIITAAKPLVLDELASTVAARKFNGADANTEGEFFSGRQVAVLEGGADSQERIAVRKPFAGSGLCGAVRILLEGADASAPGGECGSALQAVIVWP